MYISFNLTISVRSSDTEDQNERIRTLVEELENQDNLLAEKQRQYEKIFQENDLLTQQNTTFSKNLKRTKRELEEAMRQEDCRYEKFDENDRIVSQLSRKYKLAKEEKDEIERELEIAHDKHLEVVRCFKMDKNNAMEAFKVSEKMRKGEFFVINTANKFKLHLTCFFLYLKKITSRHIPKPLKSRSFLRF